MTQFNLTSEKQFSMPGDAAIFYKSLGWEPLVLPAREKAPKGKWGTAVERSDEDLFFAYGTASNVGIALGERSGGLIDIDNDWPEAALVCNFVFDLYPSFGRATSQNSHRFVRGTLPKNIRFEIPADARELFGADKGTVLELRGNKLQTMVPPSVHPNGELLRWHDDPRHIPKADGAELERYAGGVAFLAVILNRYPRGAGNRDNICLALTGTLIRAGFSDEEIDAWVTHLASLANDEEADKRGKAAASREKIEADEAAWGLPTLCELLGIEPIEKTLRKWLGLGGGGGADPDAITVWPGEMHIAVDRAEQALMRESVGIYQRSDSLVRVVRLVDCVDEEGIGRDSGAIIIRPATKPWLREQFARVAKWEKPGRKGAMIRTDPPADAASAYLDRIGEWRLRFLQGITQSPTMRADGTILQEPGYDAASGLLYDSGRIAFPRVADAPAKEEALTALRILSGPFRDFCFADEADRSVALAAVLTALVRTMFPSAPLFAIDAPTAGTGKSLLTETIAIIVTGHKPAMMSQGKTDEENEKRLSSVLMAGDQVIVIDNCDRPIEGDFLCSMLSQEMVQPRILGKSETRRLPTRCLVLATGNNLVLAGDVTRRTLMCRLDAGVERPDQLQFRFDPREEALALRPQLVVAGLTILRAYIAAGHPNRMGTIGSFEAWNIVREALVWLGCHDPEDTRDRILADDPQKAVLLDVLRLWRQSLGDQRVTLTELSSLVDRDGDVWKLVEELTANTRQPSFNARSVGRFLAKHIDRVVGGFALRAEADSSGIKRYRVIETGQRGGGSTSSDASPF
ncbi:MAG: bifunctional DNA primase/polymerase [Phyllobacterium sp.]